MIRYRILEISTQTTINLISAMRFKCYLHLMTIISNFYKWYKLTMLSAYILTSTSFQGTDWLENSHPREKSCISDNISVEHTVLSTIASLYVQKKNVKLMLK